MCWCVHRATLLFSQCHTKATRICKGIQPFLLFQVGLMKLSYWCNQILHTRLPLHANIVYIDNSPIGYLQVLENVMFWTLCQLPFMHCFSLKCGVLMCEYVQHSLFLAPIQGHGDMQGHPPIEHAWLIDKSHFAKRKQSRSTNAMPHANIKWNNLSVGITWEWKHQR